MSLCYKASVLGRVMASSAMKAAVSGHYGMLTETTLLIGDSRKARPRFTTTNTSASCALCSILVLSHPNISRMQPLRYVWRNDGSALADIKFTGSGFLWGTPHKALPPATLRHRDAPRLSITCSPSHPVAAPYRSTTTTPCLRRCYCSSIPARFNFQRRRDFRSLGLGCHELLMGLLSLIVGIYQLPKPLASQLTFLWGLLVFFTTCLKIIGGFTEIFTEADLHTTLYLSYAKNVQLSQLSVDSSGSSSSSLACFSVEKQTVLSPASFLRSVSLPNVKWKCLSISISITILLSCVAVSSGPEATDFVSTIFRGADLVSTSQFKVTNSQASGSAVNLAPTHSNFAPNSLSFYLRGISISSLFVVLSFVGRVYLNSSLGCSSNV